MKIGIARSIGVLALAAGLQLATVGLASGADVATPNLPGITSDDPFPDGCVSCHTGAMSLGKKLAALKHRNIDGKVSVVPDDCQTCHKPDAGLESMSEIAHSMHYAAGRNSDFVTKYGGSCLNCHQMAIGSGAVSVKSGRKNW